MALRNQSVKPAMARLERTVNNSALFFASTREAAFDGHQTAREVISHLVFWHREYTKIVKSISNGNTPQLRQGTFAMLNAYASRELRDRSMSQLAADLITLQQDLDESVRSLKSANVKLPFKAGGNKLVLGKWLLRIEAHIRSHLVRFRRATSS